MNQGQGDPAPAVLWTAVAAATVLGAPEPAASGIPEIVQVQNGQRILFLQPEDGGIGRLVRLVSSDPRDYLAPEWQIGARVPLP